MASRPQAAQDTPQTQAQTALDAGCSALPASRQDAVDAAESMEWLGSSGRNGQDTDSRAAERVGGKWVQVTYALIDIACVLGSGVTAFLLRFSETDPRHWLVSGRLTVAPDQPLSRYGAFLLLYVPLILLFCQLQDLYRTPRGRSSSKETLAVIKAVSFATLLLTAFIYLSGVKIVSRSVVAMSLLLNVVSLAAWRYAKRRIVIHRATRGIGARNAVIIGAGRVGQALARQMDENALLGYRFKGFLDSNHSNDPRTLGRIEDLPYIARREFIDEIFVTIPSERELVKRIAVEARHNRVDVSVVPDLYDGLAWNAPLRHIGDFPLMELHWQAIPTLGLFVKRILDVGVSAVALVVCSPLLAFLTLCVKLDSKGPVFYRSRRVGKRGRLFTCYKLRTMVCNADDLKESLRDRNERQGPFFKIENDPRITRVGRYLRKYSLDELPQLWNVLKGDMSLVGPRPHPVDDYEQYSVDHLRRLDVKPGITGLWQITARQDPSFETGMRLDLEYIDRWNQLLDFRIFCRTIWEVLRGTGN